MVKGGCLGVAGDAVLLLLVVLLAGTVVGPVTMVIVVRVAKWLGFPAVGVVVASSAAEGLLPIVKSDMEEWQMGVVEMTAHDL
jgi:hypothetical protein